MKEKEDKFILKEVEKEYNALILKR